MVESELYPANHRRLKNPVSPDGKPSFLTDSLMALFDSETVCWAWAAWPPGYQNARTENVSSRLIRGFSKCREF
jgi:hypothetical protein